MICSFCFSNIDDCYTKTHCNVSYQTVAADDVLHIIHVDDMEKRHSSITPFSAPKTGRMKKRSASSTAYKQEDDDEKTLHNKFLKAGIEYYKAQTALANLKAKKLERELSQM